jgi:outer membrane immunogenic protein
MKRILLATTALALSCPAFAADLAPVRMPLKAPPVAARPFSWTGCYIGGHLGVGWGHENFSDPNSVLFGGMSFFAPNGAGVGIDQDAGFLGGGQIGCDYQFATNWVIGAAGDFSWTDINGQATDPFFSGKSGGPITLRDKTDWLATATGRLGYAWDRLLLYAKGGAAWEHSQDSIGNLVGWYSPPFATFCSSGAAFIACNPSGSDTHAGWTVGVGLSWAFADNWSAGIEYDHYDFGSHNVTLTDPNGTFGGPTPVALSAPITVNQRIDAVKVTLDYRFNLFGR